MKKKTADVGGKILIIHEYGVGTEVKDKVLKKYPKAAPVKVLHVSQVLTEAIEFKKAVSLIICMPEVIDDANTFTAYWPGSRFVGWPEY